MAPVPCSMTIADGSLLINQLDRVDPALLPALLLDAWPAAAGLAAPGTRLDAPQLRWPPVFHHRNRPCPASIRCCTLIGCRPAGATPGTWAGAALLAAAVQPKAGLGGVAGVGERLIRRWQIHDFRHVVRELRRAWWTGPVRQMPASALRRRSTEPVAPCRKRCSTERRGPTALATSISGAWRPPLRRNNGCARPGSGTACCSGL